VNFRTREFWDRVKTRRTCIPVLQSVYFSFRRFCGFGFPVSVTQAAQWSFRICISSRCNGLYCTVRIALLNWESTNRKPFRCPKLEWTDYSTVRVRSSMAEILNREKRILNMIDILREKGWDINIIIGERRRSILKKVYNFILMITHYSISTWHNLTRWS